MSPYRAADRIMWAVDAMDIQPDDRVLEIGSGHGVALSLIAERLRGGHVVGIDRSPKMIRRAGQRNAEHVEAGTVSLVEADGASADLGDARFDKALAIHVGVFLRGNPAGELDVIRRHLVPDGRLFLSYQPFRAEEIPVTIELVSSRLRANGFEVVDRLEADVRSGRVMCVVATPG